MHYILPFLIYHFKKDKKMLYGLLLGNAIDLDHVYYRIIGRVGWFESACSSGLGSQCSFGIYPLHNVTTAIILIGVVLISYTYMKKGEKVQWVFWISLGALVNLLLDYIPLITGFVI